MQGKNFLRISDFSRDNIERLLTLSKQLKEAQKSGQDHSRLKGKSLAMIFEKPSSRTRMSFEVGMFQLGGYAVNVSANEIKMGEREPISDVARTLSRYVDAVMIRALHHWTLEEFSDAATVPVINGLSDHHHPCQAVADIFTILEHKKDLSNIKITYVGDGNNVCNSLIEICSILKINLVISCPIGYEPLFGDLPSHITICNDPVEACSASDVIYTDVWISMGQEDNTARKLQDFKGFIVSNKLMKSAKKDVVFMHCLPAHRGLEVEQSVIDGPHSIVFDQAENRLHCQKAILTVILES